MRSSTFQRPRHAPPSDSVADRRGQAEQIPGEVVMAKVRNPVEDPGSTGKWRPFVLVRRQGGTWAGIGLTTKSHYHDGNPRRAVPQPRWVGLRGPGYLWGENLVKVSAIDIGEHIGWVHPELVDLIEEQVRLNAADRAALRSSLHWENAS